MLKDKLKKIINSEENSNENNKKKIENLAFIAIILIITIVIINYIWNGNNKSNKTLTNSLGRQLATTENEKIVETNSSSYNLENRLENILNSINGVGKVKVFINYYESGEMLAMYNENSKTSVTEETDTSGRSKKSRNYRFTKRNNLSRGKWR